VENGETVRRYPLNVWMIHDDLELPQDRCRDLLLMSAEEEAAVVPCDSKHSNQRTGGSQRDTTGRKSRDSLHQISFLLSSRPHQSPQRSAYR
jgi:hypothetical protein